MSAYCHEAYLGGAATFAVFSELPEIAEILVVEEKDEADIVADEKKDGKKRTIRANL